MTEKASTDTDLADDSDMDERVKLDMDPDASAQARLGLSSHTSPTLAFLVDPQHPIRSFGAHPPAVAVLR